MSEMRFDGRKESIYRKSLDYKRPSETFLRAFSVWFVLDFDGSAQSLVGSPPRIKVRISADSSLTFSSPI